MKLFIKLLALILLAVLAYLAWVYQNGQTSITPLPYDFITKEFEGQQTAEEAHILFVGDRMGASLDPYLELINKNLDKMLKEPLRVYNWSRNGEGLHRTLAKLKSLKTYPQVVVYVGGGQEFEERRFHLSESAAILDNFLRFQDERILSLIMTAPVMSRFLYRPHKRVSFEDFVPETQEMDAMQIQMRISTTFQIFRFEMQEMIRYLKSQKSHLVLTTQPLNLDIPPKKICDNAQSPTQRVEQKDIVALLKAERSKEAYARSKALVENSVGNALNFYLKGQSAKALGQYQEARGNLQLAVIFDCELWRASPLLNEMIGQFAKKEDLFLIDFHQLLNQNFGEDELFLGELYPQHLYYQRFMNEVIAKITQILAL